MKDSFTGKEIPRGTGLMYVKKDGSISYFGDKKSEKNVLKLKRKPTKTKWTETYHSEKTKAKQKSTKKGGK
jgi:large subunit ribosomal protein L24e